MASATRLVSVIFLCLLSAVNVKHSSSEGTPVVDFDASSDATNSSISAGGKCNVYEGKWVHDSSYPLYQAFQCPYIGNNENCRRYGRPDSDYEHWRWAPSGCSIPRFNARKMLQRLRGKRLMFVGDSLSRSQWESMVCLLQGAIPAHRQILVNRYPVSSFRALDYGAFVEFYWSPLLVELDVDNRNRKILRLDRIGEQGNSWKGANILVFESSHWWTHTDSQKSWDLIVYGKQEYTAMNPMEAYRKVLMTWASWVSRNLDPKSTIVFFRSTSPKHYSSNEWNNPSGHNCYTETEPVMIWRSRPAEPEESTVLRQELRKVKFPVRLLDITAMSEYRKDAHPSVYSGELSPIQRENPQQFADCSHWCLPGVPDAWNHLLFSALVS